MSPAICKAALAVLVLLTGQSEPDPGQSVERLARRVTDYEARTELIRIGPPAVPALLGQMAGSNARLADESGGALRWIVSHWRAEPAARQILTEQIGDFAAGGAPRQRRVLAIDLLGELGGPEAVDRLAALLDHVELFSAAVPALARIEGGAAREALVRAADSAPPERRGAFYAALGRRGEPETVSVLVAAAAGGDDHALSALAGFPNPSAIAWLTETALADGDRNRAGRAFETLLANETASRDGALLARLASGADPERLEELLTSIRAAEQFHPDLVTFLLEAPVAAALEHARLAALVALGPRLEPPIASNVVRQVLAGDAEPDLEARALLLCAARCEGAVAPDVATRLSSADAVVRHAAVEALAGMDGAVASDELLRAVRQAAGTPWAPTLVDALGRRTDAAAVEALLELLREPPGGHLDTVVEACLTMAAEVDADRARRLWAATLAVEPDPRALAGLGAVGGVAQIDALVAVLADSYGEIHTLARDALGALGVRLASSGDAIAAVRALRAAFEAGAPVETELRRLGQKVALVAHGGRVDAWWYAAGAREPFCDGGEPPGELPVILLQALDLEPVPTRRWQPRQAADPRGLIVLPPASGSAREAHWLAADLTPRTAQQAEITLRSTLPAHLWVNGEPAEILPRERSAATEERRYRAWLRQGPNRLVLGLCRPAGRLRLSVTLADAAGRPLKFTIR